MEILINSFNSGDKFLLTTSNLDLYKFFSKLGLRTVGNYHDFFEKSLGNTRDLNTDDLINKFFNCLGLDRPSCVKIKYIRVNADYSPIRFSFYIIIDLEKDKSIVFSYNMYIFPRENKYRKVNFNFDSSCLTLSTFDNSKSTRYFDKFNFIYPIEGENLLGILTKVPKYYNLYIKGFKKFVDDYNQGNLDEYFKKWKYNEFHVFSMPVMNLPLLYSKFFNSGIVDYDLFIGFIASTYKDCKKIDEVIDLLESGKVNNALSIINSDLNYFYDNYISTESSIQKFKSILDECELEIRDLVLSLSKKHNIHPDFIENGWNSNEMPIDITKSIKWNREEIQKILKKNKSKSN